MRSNSRFLQHLVAAVAFSTAVAACSSAGDDEPTQESSDVSNGKGLNEYERATFYHLSEGAEVYPYAVIEALEQADGTPFMTNYERFGLIRDPLLPDGLPIGITYSRGFMGANCAVCHVGQVSYRGTSLIVDGAPNMFNLKDFYAEVVTELKATFADAARAKRFVAKAHLSRQDLGGLFDRAGQLAWGLRNPIEEPTPWGRGRSDAFGIARFTAFGPSDAANKRPLTAPTSVPSLWGFEKNAWLHWNGNTNSVIERNIGQALGTGALPENIEPRSIHSLELLARKLPAPRWPTAIFGSLDAKKHERGAAIYRQRCAGCHDGYSVGNGRRDFVMLGLDDIGTDPNHALNFSKPVFNYDGVREQPFDVATSKLMTTVKNAAYARTGVTPDERAEFDYGSDPVWRDPFSATGKAYQARSLEGIWASPPYLHNGAVPTLDDLLKPSSQRPEQFPIGHREYDPVKVGYRTDIGPTDPMFVSMLDTKLEGNSNRGHEGPRYGTDLSDQDRGALLEYLKSL